MAGASLKFDVWLPLESRFTRTVTCAESRAHRRKPATGIVKRAMRELMFVLLGEEHVGAEREDILRLGEAAPDRDGRPRGFFGRALQDEPGPASRSRAGD